MDTIEPSRDPKPQPNEVLKLAAGVAAAFAGSFFKSWLGWPASRLPNDPPRVAQARARADWLGRFVKVSVATVGVVFFAFMVAKVIVAAVTSATPPTWAQYIQLGAAGVSVGLLGPTITQIFSTAAKFADYVDDGQPSDLMIEFVKVGTTALGLAIAIISITGKPTQTVQKPEVDADAFNVVGPALYLTAAPPEELDPVPFIPLFRFQNAQVKGATLSGRGLALSPDQERILEQTLASLARCGTAEAPIRVRTVGFASSAPFVDDKGQPLANWRELNIATANARAKAVSAVVARIATTMSNIAVEAPYEWSKPDEMDRERERRRGEFEPPGIEERERPVFQRTVVLEIRSATPRCIRLVAESRRMPPNTTASMNPPGGPEPNSADDMLKSAPPTGGA